LSFQLLNYRCSKNRSNSLTTNLCNILYADGHVQHWRDSKIPCKVQLLIDTTTVLQEGLSPRAAHSTTPYILRSICFLWVAGCMIPRIFHTDNWWRLD
jgi:prepilin-type processing-associated H-X9-DG protein